MTPATHIVPATAADADPVMVVMQQAFDPSFGEAWTRGQCLGILGLPGVWMLLASRADEPAGFALARVIVDEAELLLLGVRPGFRRSGVASALLAQVKAGAAERGAHRLHLEVRDGNTAMSLYEAEGFAQVGRRPGYYRGGDGRLFDALSLSIEIG